MSTTYLPVRSIRKLGIASQRRAMVPKKRAERHDVADDHEGNRERWHVPLRREEARSLDPGRMGKSNCQIDHPNDIARPRERASTMPTAAQRDHRRQGNHGRQRGAQRCRRGEGLRHLGSEIRNEKANAEDAKELRCEPHGQRMQVAPGESAELHPDAGEVRPPAADLGRYEITEDPADRRKLKTPTLRNVALTSPYMHDGSLPTLAAVVEYYDDGGRPHDGLDPRLHPLGLTQEDKDALVAFLESLTGNNVDALVADAHAAPVGDPR